jgi:NAD(P)H dehydrogenase (quinone)
MCLLVLAACGCHDGVMTTTATLLVTGAAGHLGRRVVELLLDAGATHVVATTRRPDQLAGLAARGIEVRHADFEDPASLPQAFAEVDRVLLVSTDAIGRRVPQHRNAIAAAALAGVSHIVYTSFAGLDAWGTHNVVAREHLDTEAALKASGVGWTILRNNMYADTLLRRLTGAVASGSLVAATGEGKVGIVTREDCARAAAHALLRPPSGNQTLDITGPAAVRYGDFATIAGTVTAKPVTYQPVAGDAVSSAMIAAGVPETMAGLVAGFDVAVSRGILDIATDSVEELTGSRPTSVEEFLLAHRQELLGV